MFITASNGKKVRLSQSTIDSLVKDLTTREFEIGMYLTHDNKDGTQTDYQLVRILQPDGSLRAYLINEDTGRARNSRKVVVVQTDQPDEYPDGYVTDLPAEKDRFLEPDGGGYIDC